MTSSRDGQTQYEYLYETTDFTSANAVLDYFQGPYETDKKMAIAKNGLDRLLWCVFMKVTRHKDLYEKQYSKEKYLKLIVGKTGKTPSQYVDDDFGVVMRQLSNSKQGLFTASFNVADANAIPLEEIDLKSPTNKKNALLDKKSEVKEMGCACLFL